VQHRPAEEKERGNREERAATGKQRALKVSLNRRIHDRLDAAFPAAMQTLADTVVNHDGVVDRVTGDGRMAPTITRESSRPKIAKRRPVIMTSCNNATNAPIAKETQTAWSHKPKYEHAET